MHTFYNDNANSFTFRQLTRRIYLLKEELLTKVVLLTFQSVADLRGYAGFIFYILLVLSTFQMG